MPVKSCMHACDNTCLTFLADYCTFKQFLYKVLNKMDLCLVYNIVSRKLLYPAPYPTYHQRSGYSTVYTTSLLIFETYKL